MIPIQPRYVVAALAASMLVACSTTETAQNDGAAAREYQTGSNVPRKIRSGEKVQTYGADSVQTPLPPPSRPPASAGGG